MRKRLAVWLRSLADRLDSIAEPARSDPAMFLRSGCVSLRQPSPDPVSGTEFPAFIEPRDFNEYAYWPSVRAGGGMYL